MEYRNNMPVYNWTYRKPALNAKKEQTKGAVLFSYGKTDCKKIIRKLFFMRIEKPFFQGFLLIVVLKRKKVTCKMNRTDQRRVYSLCVRSYTNEQHLDLFLLLSSWNRLTWLSKNDDLFFLTQLEHFNFCSV